MSKDEDKAFALIQKKRELLLPLVEKYEGKLIKEISDGRKFLSYPIPIPKAIVNCRRVGES